MLEAAEIFGATAFFKTEISLAEAVETFDVLPEVETIETPANVYTRASLGVS